MKIPRPSLYHAGPGITRLAPLIIALLLSLRVATWFDCPHISLSGDLRLFFNPRAAEARYLYFIDEIDYGLPSPYPFRLLNPIEAITFLLVEAGLGNPCMVEAITVYLVSVASFLVAYWMFREITGSRVGSLAAAFYIYNTPFMVIDREISAIGVTYTLMIVSLSTLTLLKAVRGSRIALLLLPLTLLMTMATYPNVRLFYITVYWQFIVITYLYIIKWVDIAYNRDVVQVKLRITPIIESVKRLAPAAVLSIIALTPPIAFTLYNIDLLLSEFQSLNLEGVQPRTGILDVFRMLYMWSFTAYEDSLGAYYVPYHKAYYTTFMIIVTLAMTLALPLLGAALGQAPRRGRLLLLGVLAVLYVLVLGSKALGDLYLWLVKAKIAAPFRNTYNWYYLVALTSGLLVALLAARASAWRPPWGLTLLASLIIFLGVVSAFPLYTGSVATNWLDPSQGKGYNVPIHLYNRLDSILDEARWTTFMPPTGVYIVFKYGDILWGFGNPYPIFLSKPIVTGAGSEYMVSPYQEEIREYLRMVATGSQGWREASRLWGIGYIVLSKGVDKYEPQLLFKDAGYDSVRKVLAGMRPEARLDFIEVYKLDSYPMLYAADKIVPYTGGLQGMAQEASGLAGYPGKLAMVDKEEDHVPGVTCGSEALEWVKKSPAQYEGLIRCSGRLMIVLLTGYDDRWKMDIEGGVVVKHVRVNEIMNGWLVEAEEGARFKITYQLHADMARITLASAIAYLAGSALYISYYRYRGRAP
ncbi:MAG: hypothetical protein GSR84_05775 [Desulfurococcales archaeon]|nr:hypothetical protein [Desulfurococcales archaeon]